MAGKRSEDNEHHEETYAALAWEDVAGDGEPDGQSYWWNQKEAITQAKRYLQSRFKFAGVWKKDDSGYFEIEIFTAFADGVEP